ncbi:SdrD B-like domain-containing protein [Deinococcus humi]|uniref:SD-repeat containing protein B domain-containing protein n=1 Tax=Deinococcus humi TaxID=662880 RepID=A0A7W8JTX0_9DEIO|nr:SdrD B-like domain-containing protein [Deinococcus humi]MBB5362875.1 hypothetical protein [Deinococcus humi]GGO25870.1 hypothetical protein GCM10008949_16070 [Deinococcus humi]
MSRRLTLLALLLLMPPALPSLSAAAQGSGPSVTAPAPREGTPGGYVTLTFQAQGQGDYEFTVDSPPEWAPVTRTRNVKLNGQTLIPVTFQVPALAPAGESPPLVLRVLQGGTEVARAQTQVRVLPRARVALRSPANLSGTPGQTLSVPLEVTNLGNQPDTIRLTITNADRQPQLDTSEVTLKPGESRTVNATLKLDRVSEGYLYILFFEATSANNPEISARARTNSVFTTVAGRSGTAVQGPRLTFSVRAAVEAGVDWSPGGRSTSIRYSLQPTVGGQLSDYVKGSLGISGLDGSLTRPLPDNPTFGVQLDGGRWTAELEGGRDGFGVRGTLDTGPWKLRSRARYSRLVAGQVYNAGVGASTQVAGGPLDVEVTTTVVRQDGETQRTDTLGVRYGRRLSPNLDLSVGLAGVGFSAAGRYQGDLFVTEELSYVTNIFDVTQTYSGSLSGLHTLGVSGGLSGIQPFGVRAAASLQRQPGGLTWSASGLGLYSGPAGFGASVSGRVQGGTVPTARAQWQATAGITSPSLRLLGAAISGSAQYLIASDDDTPGELAHTVQVNASLSTAALDANALASWSRNPVPAGGSQDKVYLGLTGAYAWKSNTFAALYSFERRSGTVPGTPAGSPQDPSTTQTLGLSWERSWTDRINTRLDFNHAEIWTGSERRRPDQAALTIGIRDVGLPGVNVSTGYRVIAPSGLLAGSLTQGVRVGVSYDLTRVIATPDFLVNTFGGRRGGEVRGVLYRDTNLNGKQDDGEAGLPGVTVRVGNASAVSDAQGRYSVRAPVGSFPLAFPSGLPATVEALDTPNVTVTENGRSEQNVAFAPVGNLEVLVFEDTNRNGSPDPGEQPIPYAGISLSGPAVRAVQADSRGYARLGTLPPGTYTVALNPVSLPEDYTATTEAKRAELKIGERLPALALGAAMPPRQSVTTYTGGTLAVLGRLSSGPSTPGAKVELTVQTQGARTVNVEVLGQTLTPKLEGNRASLEFTVPAGTVPGSYDVKVTAVGDGESKVLILKLLVMAGK